MAVRKKEKIAKAIENCIALSELISTKQYKKQSTQRGLSEASDKLPESDTRKLLGRTTGFLEARRHI